MRDVFCPRVTPVINQDKPVRVFKNLTYGCYGILQDGKLKASARQVQLTDVEFRVRESGRQRALKEQRRNVHAFAVGTLVDWVHPTETRQLTGVEGRVISYNPVGSGLFFDKLTNDPVMTADIVHLDEDGAVYA